MKIEDFSTEELEKELNKRSEQRRINQIEQFHQNIPKLAKKNKLKLAYFLTDYGDGPQFTFGIIKNKEFLDFYYDSGIEYQEFQKYIPDGFREASESYYEYDGDINEGIKLVESCGYKFYHIKD